jgi:MFS family permease
VSEAVLPPAKAVSLEEIEDSLVDGDLPFRPGSARAALAQRTFRIVFLGAFASNIGSWMQSVILAAYAYSITRSSTFVGIVVFAGMGQQLLLSIAGGAVADRIDRRRLLIGVSIEQMVASGLLAVLCLSSDPSKALIVALVAAIGIGNAAYAPAYSAVLPALVGRENLAGAISLNSAQMNASRVVGPAIGGLAYHLVGPSWVFAGNALTYLFVIGALASVRLPHVVSSAAGRGLRQLTAGITAARADRVVTRALVTVATFSLFCLPFIGLMPVVAAREFAMSPKSPGYGILYACFGLGALAGALSIGTVLAGVPKDRIVRAGMLGFAAMLAVFALVRTAVLAFPVVALVGAFYFAMLTALSTAMQERLSDEVRGRVMALWIMGFGGTVALGNLIGGPVADAVGTRVLLLAGAVVAIGLAGYADVRAPERAASSCTTPASPAIDGMHGTAHLHGTAAGGDLRPAAGGREGGRGVRLRGVLPVGPLPPHGRRRSRPGADRVVGYARRART